MRKITLSIILLLSLYIFIFSHDHRSITQITYVNSIGIEYNNETNEFTMTFLILNNYTIAQSGNSPSFTNTHAYTATASSSTILEAENKIRNNSNTKFDLSHIRSFIINDNFFVNGNIIKLYEYFKNNVKYHHTFEIYTTKDNICEIYKLENFSEVSGYYTILVNTQNNIPVKHVRYNDFCNDILIKDYTKYYHRIKINKGIINDTDKKYISLEYDGISFITNEYSLCSFKHQNLNGLAYVTTKINRSFPIIYNTKELTFLPNKFNVNSKVKDGYLVIKVSINGYFLNNYQLDNVVLKQILCDKIEEDLRMMFETLNNYDIDIYNINYKYNNKYDYKTIPVKYEFDINITK